jgi:2-(1,2-epoxy-1,2-dihydrophenyl)acetyl-CoA isomerase
MEMMLLAKPVTAQRALEIGMVTEVVADADVQRTAQELAERMAAGPTTAYGTIKAALRIAAGADLPTALTNEGAGQAFAGATADHREAVEAFVAKRPPAFTGH